MIDRIVDFLRSWLRLVRAIEGLLVDSLAALSPWLAPIIPAFMVWRGLTIRLDFPWWVAGAGAGVVELLGLSAVFTAFQFFDYNESKKVSWQGAPARVAFVVVAFYLVVVLTVNVLLDDAPVIYLVAKGLLSTLSVCGAVVIALRAQHARRLDAIDDERRERKAARVNVSHVAAYPLDLSPTPSQQGRGGGVHDWRRLPDSVRVEVAGMGVSDVVARFGIPERTARHWVALSKKYSEVENV